MRSLADLVQSLPAELYRELFILTFTAPYGESVTIDKTYKPPNLLQVSRDTRELFSKSYYRDSIFYISIHQLRRYVESLKAISHRTIRLKAWNIFITHYTTIDRLHGLLVASDLEVYRLLGSGRQVNSAMKTRVHFLSSTEADTIAWLSSSDVASEVFRNPQGSAWYWYQAMCAEV